MSGRGGNPDTLLHRLERATAGERGITFIDEGEPVRVSWGRLHEEARAVAAWLQARGVVPGDRVALIGTTGRGLVASIQGVWLAGAATVVLPLPLRLDSAPAFAAQTRNRIRQANPALVLVQPAFAEFMVPEHGDPPVAMLPGVDSGTLPRPDRYDPPALGSSSLAILQFTSGATSDPKGVMITHGTLCANLDGIVAASRLDAEHDVVVSWLPLYHDMGLIGLLGTPMSVGAEVVLAAPHRFMAHPANWTQWLSTYRGTVTGAPNFAYALAARTMEREGDLDLTSVRAELNGAEPIDPAGVDRFNAAGARHGLDPGAILCVYGLAEATLAVTFPEPGTGMATDTVDRWALEGAGVASPVADGSGARRLARLGTAIPGLEVRIVGRSGGDPVPERTVGEIEVAGNSITPGYFGRPEATAATFHDGWLRTGDLGYVADGELVVCGRIKDVIIVGGRNVYPQDVEWVTAEVEGIRAGNVVAFGIEGRGGRERVAVVAETRSTDLGPLRRAVGKRVHDVLGLSLADVVLVPPGTLPKTSSGKLQRSLSRQRYLADELTA